MNYIDLTNNTSGTTDYTGLDNKPQINNVTLSGNKSLADLGINQPLPNGYTITVDANGNGDFTDIQSAIDSLTGKYSAGAVIISIVAGIYTNNSVYTIDTRQFNFARLYIKGASKSTTILNRTTKGHIFVTSHYGTPVEFNDMTLSGVKDSSSDYCSCLRAEQGAYCIIENMQFENSPSYLVLSRGGSTIEVQDNITLNNASYGIHAFNSGSVKTSVEIVYTNITASNITTLLDVNNAGVIRLPNITLTQTNVINTVSQTKNTITNSGLIMTNL